MAQLIAWISPWVTSIQVASLSLKCAASLSAGGIALAPGWLCQPGIMLPSPATTGTAHGSRPPRDRGSGGKHRVFPGRWETCHGVNPGRVQPQDIKSGSDGRFHFEELWHTSLTAIADNCSFRE